jgi:hypothetical protein
MAHTNITTRIMQHRINALVAENAALKSEISHLLGEKQNETRPDPEAFAQLLDAMAAEDEANGIFDHLDPEERDYGTGGQEWVDPNTGKDTWHS